MTREGRKAVVEIKYEMETLWPNEQICICRMQVSIREFRASMNIDDAKR